MWIGADFEDPLPEELQRAFDGPTTLPPSR